MQIEIGINEQDRKAIAEGLSKVLADSYVLYLKTHNFHWNVTGAAFNDLHALFGDYYRDLADAVDEIAERIRTLGYVAPASFSRFSELSSIEEENGVPEARAMIAQLLDGQEAVIRTVRGILPVVQEVNDEATADLLTQRLQKHEKNAWVLRSLLD